MQFMICDFCLLMEGIAADIHTYIYIYIYIYIYMCVCVLKGFLDSKVIVLMLQENGESIVYT
jgi:hypothetical protein